MSDKRRVETGKQPPSRKGLHLCPACGSRSAYRYGRTHSGRQRYLCLVCQRQFSAGGSRRQFAGRRPECPICGRLMHVYRRSGSLIRFRCSAYPNCRTYVKISLAEEEQ